MLAHTMPAIFMRYGSWLVTGFALVISMVAAALSIAVGADPIRIDGNELEFAVISGELVIRRVLHEFQLLYNTVVDGNRVSLTIVLRIEPQSEVGSPSSVPEERDPSTSPVPPYSAPVPNQDRNIFYSDLPFQLRCPLCPHPLEIGEICYHPNRGVNVLRRSPEDIESRVEILNNPFEFLRIIPGPGSNLHHHYPDSNLPTTPLIERAIRIALAPDSPPPLSSSPSPSPSPRHAHPFSSLVRDSPEPVALPTRGFRRGRGNGNRIHGPPGTPSRSNRGRGTPATPRGGVPLREVSNLATEPTRTPVRRENRQPDVQVPRRGTRSRRRNVPDSHAGPSSRS